jgi:hypothetical protein
LVCGGGWWGGGGGGGGGGARAAPPPLPRPYFLEVPSSNIVKTTLNWSLNSQWLTALYGGRVSVLGNVWYELGLSAKSLSQNLELIYSGPSFRAVV